MTVKPNLHIALVQPDLEWLNPRANLHHLSCLIASIQPSVDLIILPEMFTSGFTQKPESLISVDQALPWMKQHACKHQAAIVGSVAYELSDEQNSNKSYVNRLFFVEPDGEVSFYDKCHLFQMGGEHLRYQAGKLRSTVEYLGWRFLLTICYDLRFPVFCRNQGDYDAMICVANWPGVRRHPWRTLLQARAIENQVYVMGVNRVGVDGNQLSYNGDSMAVDIQGNILADGGSGQEAILLAELSAAELAQARESFPVWQDADSFSIN